jgi:hypothetical protein
MAVIRVSVDRTKWFFAQQCTPAGTVDLVGGEGHPRYQGLQIPQCVAVAIAYDSEVRAVRLGHRDGPFDRMVHVVEGCPVAFNNPQSRLVDLARADWTDGMLILECAETLADVGSLSVLVAAATAVQVDGSPSVLNVYCQTPRISPGAVYALGIGFRVGGVGAAPTICTQNISADGLRAGHTFRSAGTLAVLGIVSTGLSAVPTAAVTAIPGRSAVVYNYTDAGATFYGFVGARSV